MLALLEKHLHLRVVWKGFNIDGLINNLPNFSVMSNKFYLPILILAAIVSFSSCAKLKPLSQDNIKVNPNPLEAVAGQVPVTINATIPAKWFVKKGVVTVTPVLRYQGGEAIGTSYTFQGEKVKGNNTVVPYKEGANVTMTSSFKYVPEMKKSELYLVFDAKVKKKVVKLPDLKIADGVVSTSELATAENTTPAIAPDKFQRITKDAYVADIMFLIQQAVIRDNQLKSDAMKDWNSTVKEANEAPNKNVAVEIQAYASPDGPLDLNTSLSENREKNTSKYLEKQFKKEEISDVPVDARYTAEDWAGFKELVEKSDMQDKDLVLRVLSMYSDPEQRNAELKKMSSVFSYLAEEILPKLRRSKLTANVETIGKSDEEIKALASSDPKSLTVEELLYAATLTKSLNEKAAIYKSVTQNYPNDFRGYNNLGMVYFQEGKVSDAEKMFNKAAQIAPKAPEVNMNLGLIALANGDKAKAEQYFGKAAGTPELGEALGVLYIENGEYAKAVNAFGSSKTNNAAIAQILAKDYNKAQSTLNGVANPDALTSYLKAIVAARTNNQSGVISNLKTAIQMDKSMAQEAATDLEFAKYYSNSEFANLVK